MKRFFVQGTDVLHRELQHLAIDLGTSAEKLGGRFIEESIARYRAEQAAQKRKPMKP